MNYRFSFRKAISLFFALLFVLSVSPVNAVAENAGGESEDSNVALVLESDSMSVVVGKTVQMSARVTGVESQPAIRWSTSDVSVATVDYTGKVKGVSIGRAVITAEAIVGDEKITGEFAINVVTEGNFLKDLLEKNQILSYQYSYTDDFYYANDKEAWQHNFGFGKIYDYAAPFLLLEYDYVRVFFTYENKDWMIQLWKGQYGMLFYGGEIGIYNREHSENGVNEWTMYNCPGESDWLNMEMSIYHEQTNGTWKREFTREYGKHWWCTGFKNGHLRQQEPADELRMVGRITFKDEVMTKYFRDGLMECGFEYMASKDNVGLDQFAVDGNDVYFCWQNINDAESTMAIKVSVGVLSSIFLLPFMPYILPLVGMFGVLVILVSAIL